MCIRLANTLHFLLPLVLVMLHVLLPIHVLHNLVRVAGAPCVCMSLPITLYVLLHSAGVVVAYVAAFVGSAALCAVLFPFAGRGCWKTTVETLPDAIAFNFLFDAAHAVIDVAYSVAS